MSDEPTTCGYCAAPEDPDEHSMVLHRVDCPYVTNIFPVTERHADVACPSCGCPFKDEEFYTTIVIPESHPTAIEVTERVRETYHDENIRPVFAVCIGCAVSQREIPYD